MELSSKSLGFISLVWFVLMGTCFQNTFLMIFLGWFSWLFYVSGGKSRVLKGPECRFWEGKGSCLWLIVRLTLDWDFRDCFYHLSSFSSSVEKVYFALNLIPTNIGWVPWIICWGLALWIQKQERHNPCLQGACLYSRGDRKETANSKVIWWQR